MSILVLTSDTLIGTPATGNIEYSGQFYGTDSNASRAQIQRITQGTAVASTSGTSITFSSLPTWIKRITVMFNGVSTSGTSIPLVQLGAGSVTSTGYLGASSNIQSATTSFNYTTGIGIANGGSAAAVIHGAIVFTSLGSNAWVAAGVLGKSEAAITISSAGSVTLGGTLDRVVITTVNGTDTFDAGSINILYEG